MPTFEENGIKYMTNVDKANILVKHFESVHNCDERKQIDRDIKSLLADETNTDTKTYQKIAVTPLDIKNILKRLPNNKAPGKDGIDYKLIKNLRGKGVVQLMYLVNNILRCQHWPGKWKEAEIIPFCKPGKDPTNYKNYKPISLLSSISKVVEKLVLEQLDRITEKNIRDEHQFGFKRQHNTTQQLARITTWF